LALLVVEENAQENKIHHWTQFVRQTAKKVFYVVMRRDGARNPAQGLVPRLRERFASTGLECGVHFAGKKRQSSAPEQELATR
jgi:hypothetical protein